MLTEADGLGQGAKRSYLEQPGIWRAYDDALFGALAKVQAPPQLSDLERIETEGIVRGATFFDEFTPDKLAERQAFHTRCIATFAERDLVFFDPDNGLEVKSVPNGRKRSNKYVFLDEIADHYAAGRSVLVYQQLGRSCRARSSSRKRRQSSGGPAWRVKVGIRHSARCVPAGGPA
jgi:hypothetical protein